MATAVTVRADFSTDELRRLAAASKHANQSRRLLSLAAVLDGMSRADAARIGGMDRQTLRDWVHRFNERGPEGLKDSWSKGHPPRLSAEQLAQLAEVVETGPARPRAQSGREHLAVPAPELASVMGPSVSIPNPAAGYLLPSVVGALAAT